MRYFYPKISDKYESPHVITAFSGRYNVLMMGDSETPKSNKTASVIGVLEPLTQFSNIPQRHMQYERKYGAWLAEAYGFANTNIFICYAYLLWKRRKEMPSAFSAEFKYIDDRVRVAFDDTGTNYMSLSEWFAYCVKNNMHMGFEMFASVLGTITRCFFNDDSTEKTITANLDDAMLVVKPGKHAVTFNDLDHNHRAAVKHMKRYYSKRFWYHYYKDPAIPNKGSKLRIGSEVRDIQFVMVEPVLTAHSVALTRDSDDIKKLYERFAINYQPVYSKSAHDSMVVRIESDNVCEDDMHRAAQLEVGAKYNIMKNLCDINCEFAFVVGIKKHVELPAQGNEITELIDFVEGRGMGILIRSPSGVWGSKRQEMVVGSHADALVLYRQLRPLSSIRVVGFTFNDLNYVNLLKLKGFEIFKVLMNVRNVHQVISLYKK